MLESEVFKNVFGSNIGKFSVCYITVSVTIREADYDMSLEWSQIDLLATHKAFGSLMDINLPGVLLVICGQSLSDVIVKVLGIAFHQF